MDFTISCSQCTASCCRLEVMLIGDTGVPKQYIVEDQWGAQTMRRLDDGWCIAVDRQAFLCTIYENRPWICREFAVGSYECMEAKGEGGSSSD